MKLYKYRSLQNYEYVLDIILNERLYCSLYTDLNDPFEGLFYTVIDTRYLHLHPDFKDKFRRSFLSFFNSPIFKYNKNVKDLDKDISKYRICSLSSSIKDVRLWSHYADRHKGIVFEIDFSGIETQAKEVKYFDNLQRFDDSLLGSSSPHEVLLCKTTHWEYESEYRILHNNDYFSIKDKIAAIYVGSRISENDLIYLTKIIPKSIPIYNTKIDKDKIEVLAGSQINV